MSQRRQSIYLTLRIFGFGSHLWIPSDKPDPTGLLFTPLPFHFSLPTWLSQLILPSLARTHLRSSTDSLTTRRVSFALRQGRVRAVMIPTVIRRKAPIVPTPRSHHREPYTYTRTLNRKARQAKGRKDQQLTTLFNAIRCVEQCARRQPPQASVRQYTQNENEAHLPCFCVRFIAIAIATLSLPCFTAATDHCADSYGCW